MQKHAHTATTAAVATRSEMLRDVSAMIEAIDDVDIEKDVEESIEEVDADQPVALDEIEEVDEEPTSRASGLGALFELGGAEDDQAGGGEESLLEQASEVVLPSEHTPLAERSFVSWFLTLEERREEAAVLRFKHVKPVPLDGRSVLALSTLFPTKAVRLYLPWWDASNVSSKPSDSYELCYSTKLSGARKFGYPYDPIVVRRERAGTSAIVAVVHEGLLFPREAEMPMLTELLEELASDPKEFFDRVGKRWGHCLCCKRELTASKSLERSIGPVCYKRVKRLDDFMRSTRKYEGAPVGTGLKEAVVATAHALNPVEREGATKLSALYLGALASGLSFDWRHGVVLEPAHPGQGRGVIIGELDELQVPRDQRYKYSRRVGRASKECTLFVVRRGSPLTTSMLVQLGCEWREDVGAWAVPKEDVKHVCRYFAVSKPHDGGPQLPSSVASTATLPLPAAAASSASGGGGGGSGSTGPKKSSPARARPMTLEERDGALYIGGNTFPHRATLKQVGASWDPAKKLWVAPLSAKELVDAAVARANVEA
jgi:hypothetical protein